jgi:hypothetical protein
MRHPLLDPVLRRCLLAAVLSAVATAVPSAAGSPVEFNREVRPILADNCFPCHGPDKARRKAGLRLDLDPTALDRTELHRRITTKDPRERMPPARSGHKLTPDQIKLLVRWIEQGARWQKHWSLIAPQRKPPPKVLDPTWIRNPLDAFVLARLEREGLAPAPEADRTTLLRRVTLDLTGLPPTPAELDSFLADPSPLAYEKAVDRLLASPRFGERMARPWLDAARYADTNGYQNDGDRIMWRWRDWVIDAFNRNLPFDQFTIEQLAGDLLPGATLDQRIATGFNRNHRGNAEGGIIPEEYAVEYVVDRVDTTSTVWLGLTMACARCHDHKYDPFTQKEFYQLFAFFNNVPEKGKAVKYGNSPPFIPAPTPRQQAQLAELERHLAADTSEVARLEPALTAAQTEWEKSVMARAIIEWTPSRGLLAHYPLDGNASERTGHSPGGRFQEGPPAYVPGRTGRAADFDGRRFFDAGDVANFGYFDKFSCAAWVSPRGSQGGAILSRMSDTAMAEGYNFHVEGGKVQVNLVKRWLDDAVRVETADRLSLDRWSHVLMTYDGSRTAQGIHIYVNGQPQKLKINLDELNQTFATDEPLRIGSRGTGSRFVGAIGDVRIYRGALSADEAAMIANPDSITAIAALPSQKRSRAQALKIRTYFLDKHAPSSLREAHENLAGLRRKRDNLLESLPTTMVMEELPTPRDAFVLQRGAYDKPGEKVQAAVPASLPPMPSGAPRNRLGLARWLVDLANPLTARVAVNRFWQLYFGTGLVKTVEDFGTQGEWPLHPELLDWLAMEFVCTGWDVKRLQRTIVTSATYRQSSRLTPALWQRDPENRLLARGPRFRLSAEAIRDQALAASGLLVEKLGGPSVKPYQPPGLWKELTGAEEYVQDHGENLYRRSLYTFWKRTVAPPAMLTFDAAGRETCIVRETRTNTPLQALTLMNDVTYVEAARVLAQRVMTEAGASPEERIRLAFRLVTARQPRPHELQVLLRGFAASCQRYRVDSSAALELIKVGESPWNARFDAVELAAYATVAGLIMNLDETVTKE